MTPEKTILLVGHTTETVRTAKSLGLDVVLFQHPSKFELAQAELADATLLVNYTDWSVTRPLVEAAHTVWEFSVALSLTEPGLEIAGRINDLFGLGGTGYEITHRLRDKWVMRQHLAAAGAPTIGAHLLTDRESMARFGLRYGYPFIVKPTDLTASYGVLRVTGPWDLDRAWSQVLQARVDGVTHGTKLFEIREFVMEEYVDGPEFSVEAFSFGGRHVVLAVTEKLVGGEGQLVELGHTLPARIDARLEAEIVRATTDFLMVMGLQDGPSHTEVRIGPRGPVVIESHNRFGGDHIKDLLQSAYGIDLVRLAVGWPFRLVGELQERPQPLGGACVRFLHRDPGRVVAVGGIEELRAQPEVIFAELKVQAGDMVRPLRDNWDRLGLVAVAGPNSDAAVARCKELIHASVRIEMRDPAPLAEART